MHSTDSLLHSVAYWEVTTDMEKIMQIASKLLVLYWNVCFYIYVT